MPITESVILLHGLARSARAMHSMARYLEYNGYHVINLGYPSRQYDIPTLAGMIRNEIEQRSRGIEQIHFVTHSMGGILLRYIQRHAPLPNLGRVVMLSPPNHGSEVVDKLKHWWLFRWINGPAGQQLGTDANSIPGQLGAVDFELGVITGDRSINWINSLLIPGPDDGKVSLTSACVDGMSDCRVVHTTHPLIMRHRLTQDHCLEFLRHGRFIEDK